MSIRQLFNCSSRARVIIVWFNCYGSMSELACVLILERTGLELQEPCVEVLRNN